MKKIIINAIFALAVLSTFFSCIDDFRFGDRALDKPLGVELTIDSIYASAELARRHYYSLYWYTPTPVPTFGGVEMNGDWYEGLSDCIHSVLTWGGLNVFWYNGDYNSTSSVTNNRWAYGSSSRCYEGIRIGWTIIENIDRVPDMSNAEKARIKAGVKVIIAGKYWEFFRHYGGVPIVDRVMSADDDIQTERATIEEMYDFMIKLLDEAIAEPELPWALPQHEISEWWGRMTKAAAYGQKMLVQLHAASPIFNDHEPYYTEDTNHEAITRRYVWWGGYKPELWQELLKTCREFEQLNNASGNIYRLNQPTVRNEEGYMTAFRNAYLARADFYSSAPGTFEIVYPHLDRYQNSWWDRFFLYASYAAGWGQQAPTAEFMEMFGWADGRVFDPTGFYANVPRPNIPTSTDEPYLVPDVVKNRPSRPDNYYMYDNRDPRLYETLWVQKRGRRYTSSDVEIWPRGNAISQRPSGFAHGICHHKWVLNMTGDARNRHFCWPIFRMGAFHLIYAEALAETGDLAGACREINKVRDRVGLPPIETSNPQLNLTSNKENLIKQILRERACELGYEDTRFMDMVRRKLQDDFTKPLHGVWTYRMDGKQGAMVAGEPYPELWYIKTPITTPVRRWWTPGYWSNRFYLTCFPQNELQKDYGLVQNPGW
jgi:hypothetical protein